MPEQSTILEDETQQGFFSIQLSDNASARERELADRAHAVLATIRINSESKPSLKETLPELRNNVVLGLKGANGEQPDPDSALKRIDQLRDQLATTLKEEHTAPTASALAMAGAFFVNLPLKQDPSADPRGLLFRMKEGVSAVPADQMVLKDAIEDTLITLQVIFPEPRSEKSGDTVQAGQLRKYMQYRTKLLSLAQVGLQSEPAFPAVATQALNTLRSEVVAREGGRVKNGHMRVLGFWAFGSAAAIAIAYAVVSSCPWMPAVFKKNQNFFLLLAGCMLGTWLSFGARRVVLSFSDLGRLENDMLEPPIRLLFVGLFTLALGLIFVCDIVDVKFGNFTTDLLLQSGSYALLIGMLAGLSEQALPSAVSQKAAQFIGGLEK